jgi:uncharacterized membrane protein YqjE
MSDTPQAEGGLLATARRMLRTLWELAESRLELFLLELKEERIQLFGAVLLVAAGMVCAGMTLMVLTLTLVVVFWDDHRVLVLVLLTLAYAAGAAGAFWSLRRRLQRWHAFAATLDQLKKDRACFDKPS